jgi:hypothetical protein
MTSLSQRRRIVSMFVAVVLLTPISPVIADRDNERDVVVKFTKWITSVVPAVPATATPARFLMAGVVGGHIGAGGFVGEVLDRKVSSGVTANIVSLHAIYDVQAGAFSFTALIQGGSGTEGNGLLDGVILNGWKTGSRVHVEYKTEARCRENTNPPGVFPSCFRGTIRILRDSERSSD